MSDELVLVGEVLPDGQLSLFDLADIANREHALARDAGLSMLEHAIRAGDALIAAKAQVQHGEWLPWLADNFDGSEKTAENFMRIARNPQRVADLPEPSLRKALKALAQIAASTAGRYARNAAGIHDGDEFADADAVGDRWTLMLGDFRERLPEIADGNIAAIVTDPPYPAEYLPLWDDLGREAARLLMPGGVLAARCGHLYLPDVLGMLGRHLGYGWLYAEPLPGSNVRFLGRKIAVAWQPWVAFSNGPWPSGRLDWHPDLLAESPRTKARYVWEQKPSIAAEVTATLAPADGLVLDPFAGSAALGVAALGVGCRWIGVEIDPAGHAQATERLRRIT